MGIVEGRWTFAIGHFGLGYLTGKASSKYSKAKVNLPLLFTASILPDIDLVLRFLRHRGPTHSLITLTMLMVPFFLVYRKRAFPYFAALLSHILVGDFFTGGVQLFWPLSHAWFGVLNIDTMSLTNVSMELILFAVSLATMIKTRDLQTMLYSNRRDMDLIIPFFAVLAPMLATLVFYSIPTLLVIPSLFYLAVFSYSMLNGVRTRHKVVLYH